MFSQLVKDSSWLSVSTCEQTVPHLNVPVGRDRLWKLRGGLFIKVGTPQNWVLNRRCGKLKTAHPLLGSLWVKHPKKNIQRGIPYRLQNVNMTRVQTCPNIPTVTSRRLVFRSASAPPYLAGARRAPPGCRPVHGAAT